MVMGHRVGNFLWNAHWIVGEVLRWYIVGTRQPHTDLVSTPDTDVGIMTPDMR